MSERIIGLIDCRPRMASTVGSASDTVITHAQRGDSATLCGRDALKGFSWRNERVGDAERVDCKRCRKALGLSEREEDQW